MYHPYYIIGMVKFLNIKGEPRMLSQQLKWLLQQHFEGAGLGLRHFLEVSSIYFRRKLLFWDFKKDLVDLHPIF